METLLSAVRGIALREFRNQQHLAVIYGSYAYNIYTQNSDIDLLFVVEQCDKSTLDRICDAVTALHCTHGLPLDAEVLLHRKLVATWSEVQDAINAKGFSIMEGRLVASPVVKTRSFLDSDEIRLRLILNAVTGCCKIVSGDMRAFLKLQKQARINWVRIVPLLIGHYSFSSAQLVQYLTGTGDATGEYFLGFKNHNRIQSYLQSAFEQTLLECASQGFVSATANQVYHVTDLRWVNELLQSTR